MNKLYNSLAKSFRWFLKVRSYNSVNLHSLKNSRIATLKTIKIIKQSSGFFGFIQTIPTLLSIGLVWKLIAIGWTSRNIWCYSTFKCYELFYQQNCDKDQVF